MMNEVKQMKHIKHNLDDLDSFSKSNNDNNITLLSSSSYLKEEVKQESINNISTNSSSNNSNNSNEDNKNNVEKCRNNNDINILDKNFLNFNKISDDFWLNDKLFKEGCRNIWTNEIINILPNTADISIKDENNIVIENNFEKNKFAFQKNEKEENDFFSKNIKSKCLYLNFYGNNLESKNKYENDECSYMTNLTNLYYSEYESKKEIDDFVNKF